MAVPDAAVLPLQAWLVGLEGLGGLDEQAASAIAARAVVVMAAEVVTAVIERMVVSPLYFTATQAIGAWNPLPHEECPASTPRGYPWF